MEGWDPAMHRGMSYDQWAFRFQEMWFYIDYYYESDEYWSVRQLQALGLWI